VCYIELKDDTVWLNTGTEPQDEGVIWHEYGAKGHTFVGVSLAEYYHKIEALADTTTPAHLTFVKKWVDEYLGQPGSVHAEVPFKPLEDWETIQGYCTGIVAGEAAPVVPLRRLWDSFQAKAQAVNVKYNMALMDVRRLYQPGGRAPLQTGSYDCVERPAEGTVIKAIAAVGEGESLPAQPFHLDGTFGSTYKSDGSGKVGFVVVIPAVGMDTTYLFPTLLLPPPFPDGYSITVKEGAPKFRMPVNTPGTRSSQATPGVLYCVNQMPHARPKIVLANVNRLMIRVCLTGPELLTSTLADGTVFSNLRF
jgi:hypothetical protein